MNNLSTSQPETNDVIESEAVRQAITALEAQPSWWSRVQFVQSLPRQVLSESPKLRSVLPPDDLLDFCLSMVDLDRSLIFNSDFVREMLSAIQSPLVSYRQQEMWNKLHRFSQSISVTKYESHRHLRSLIPPLQRGKYILNLIKRAENDHDKASLLTELADCIASANSDDIWKLIPYCILEEDAIWNLAPGNKKIEYLLNILNKGDFSSSKRDVISDMRELLTSSSLQERIHLLSALPNTIKALPVLLLYLSETEQVEVAFPILDRNMHHEWEQHWHNLSVKAKILCVYRAAKEGKQIYPTDFINHCC